MKKILSLLMVGVVTVSCLYEKNGVTPTTTDPTTGGTDNTGTPTTGDTTSTISADLCGLVAGGSSTTNASGEVCFDTQILPAFVSYCGSSGCHDSKTKRDGYDLTSYAAIVKKGITKGNANNSKLYKVMVDTGHDRMPPAPASPVPAATVKLIADWINQGAKETKCQTNTSGGTLSDTVKISYQNHLKPILDTYCVGCHNASGASGGIRVDTYANLKTIAANGKLYGSIAQLSGYSPMPPSGKLSDCQIKAFKLWIDQGTANN